MGGYDYEESTRLRYECLDCFKVFPNYLEVQKHENQRRHEVVQNEIQIKPLADRFELLKRWLA